jgi:nucleotide-binding universal stress UspA family protein
MSTSSTSNAPRIVVGVDGSPSSRAALRWAVRQAALTGGAAEAVIVRHAPTSTGMIGGFGQSPAETADEGVVADEARQRLDAIINEEVKPDDRNKVRARVFDGHPAEALMAAAADADILAVGSRGHGGFAEVLLGSVGQYLVHHANCPVLIFRGDPRHLSA